MKPRPKNKASAANGKLGGRPPVIDWEKYDRLLGTIDDRALARMIDCTSTAVLKRRRKLGVAPFIARFGTSSDQD
jgi:hypothetical protein